MKDQFLKMAGVKTEAAFYKKYKTEKDFFKAHPEAKKMIKKAQAGTIMSGMSSYLQGMQGAQNVPNMQNIIQGQPQSPGVNARMFSGPQVDNSVSTITSSQLADDKSGYAFSGGPNTNVEKMNNIGNIVSKGAGAISGLTNIYSGLRAERKAKKEAQMWANVTNVQAKAAESEDIDTPRMYAENARKRREAMMPVNTGEEFFPIYGVGTNVLAKNGIKLESGSTIGGNPTEIQNTYSPEYDMYSDLEYEPLNDSEQVKQFIHGGHIRKAQSGIGNLLGSAAMAGMGSIFGGNESKGAAQTNTATQDSNFNAQLGNIGAGLGSALGGNNATSKLGDVLTSPLKGIPVVGEFSDLIAAPINLAGGLLNTNNRDRRKAEAKIKNNQNRMAAAQYRGNIQGQFGSYMEDGGDVPLMEQGGDLNTYWGGYAEPISYNPYLPDSGETVMFRGQSHEESDGQGNTGIGITFGNSPVEVERGEPAVKLKDGDTGEDNLTVYGNLMIPDYGVEILGDKKAKGRKFKNYIADISKTEAKQNKLIDKSTNELDELDLKTPFDKLKLSSLQANILGGNMKLKDVADKKIKAADIQNAINDTAEEYSLVADDLAKGKIKIDKKAMNMREAMFGDSISKADKGKKLKSVSAMSEAPKGQRKSGIFYGGVTNEDFEKTKQRNPWYDWENFDPSDKKDVLDFQTKFNKLAQAAGVDVRLKEDELFGKQTASADSSYFTTRERGKELEAPVIENTIEDTPIQQENKFEIIKNKKNPWLNIGYQTLKGFLDKPYEEALSPDQLMGEYYALSANQVEPVQATPYTPQLRVPYDISYQDQLNEVTADQRATQRMIGYNPAAQANVAAQAYGAKSKILADQFRANQAMKDQVYSGNIATLNDAELKNLAIYDQQYTRQEQAKSNTKAIAQAALSSIGDKLAKHKADVREYNVYKTLFPQYGFDRSGRGRFEGGYADFNTPQSQYPFYNNPNYALVKNSDGTFTYKLKEQVTEDDQVMENPKTPSMATNPINGNDVVYKDDQYEYIASPIQERNEMLPPKRTGGKIRKNYSQSSIVKAFK